MPGNAGCKINEQKKYRDILIMAGSLSQLDELKNSLEGDDVVDVSTTVSNANLSMTH